MQVHIVAEDFTLTEAIHNFIDEQLSQLKSRVPESISVTVFLKKDGPRDFRVIMKTHVYDHEVLGEGYGEDLYQNIREAKHHFDQQVHKCVDKFRARRHA